MKAAAPPTIQAACPAAASRQARTTGLRALRGTDPPATTPERFAEMLREDLAKWARVVRESGAKVD